MSVTWFRFEAGEVEALASVAPITDWKIRIDGRVARFSAAVSGVGVSLARKLNGYDVEVEINPVSTCALVPDLRRLAAIVREITESHRRVVAASEGETQGVVDTGASNHGKAAGIAVERIVRDICDRKDLSGAWERVDDDVQQEIMDTWDSIARDAITECRTARVKP